MTATRLIGMFAFLLAAAAPAVAEPPSTPVDKSAYTLFHPVPDDQLRPFLSDRPNVTTGPFTVDAGHVQLEASFGQFTEDQSTATGGDGGEHVSVGPGELRVGVTEHAEVDLTLTPFLYQRTPARPREAVPATHAHGFGDVQLQAKVNLFGNAGGDHTWDAAVGVVPYLTLPTARSGNGLGTGRVQGGVAVPAQIVLPADVVVAGMAQFDFPRNDANTATGFDVLHTVSVSRTIVGPLAGYVEYAGVTPVRLGHGYQAFVDTGLTYGVSDAVQLDVAVNVGASRDTPKFTVLAGITVRR